MRPVLQGFGSDAMRLAVRYAFTELNLQRISLYVFDYNPRAMRVYEKSGFSIEGRLRGAILREGERTDVLVMGVLRDDWLALNDLTME